MAPESQPSTSFGFAATDAEQAKVLDMKEAVSVFRLLLDRSRLHRQAAMRVKGYDHFGDDDLTTDKGGTFDAALHVYSRSLNAHTDTARLGALVLSMESSTCMPKSGTQLA